MLTATAEAVDGVGVGRTKRLYVECQETLFDQQRALRGGSRRDRGIPAIEGRVARERWARLEPRTISERRANPRKGRDIGDRVVGAAEKRRGSEPRLEHLEQALHFARVALARVVVARRRETQEMRQLPEHRADRGDLQDEPLLDDRARGRRFRQEPARLAREVQENRAALEHRVRCTFGPLVVDDHGHLVVRIHAEECRLVLVARDDVDRVRTIGERQLLEQDRHLRDIRAAHAIQVDHGRNVN